MLNWLVAGIGDITVKRVIPAILSHPRSRLVGVLTRNPSKAEPYGVPAWTDLASALSESGAGAVYVATPVYLHAPQSIAALQAGKHVLCEKPMAMDYGEACTMKHAAEEAGRMLGIAYYRRMYPKVLRAQELIRGGAIGRPVLAFATSHEHFYPTGGERTWLVDPKQAGGGPLYDIASHRIDLMNYIFGKPERACGHTSTLVHPIEVEDNATALIDYENGVRAVVDVRWHCRAGRDEFWIRGTEGEIDLTPLSGPRLTTAGREELMPTHDNVHYPCIENFAAAVLEGVPLRSSAATALWTSWVTDQVVSKN
jgi:predicted dehydrogenase